MHTLACACAHTHTKGVRYQHPEPHPEGALRCGGFSVVETVVTVFSAPGVQTGEETGDISFGCLHDERSDI